MTSGMDFRDLSYVLAIAKHQNLTRAAESLFVGQPTLSKFLSSLEESLGLHLFRKIGTRYVLTYAGERYVEHATRILQLKEDLDREMADIVKRDAGELNVAFTPIRSSYVLPDALPAFHAQYPNVRINVFEGDSEENDRRLLEGQVELAFCSAPASTCPQIEVRTLWEEELLICTRADHPLKGQAKPGDPYPTLDPALLKNELVLMMKPEHRTRQILDDCLGERGIRFARVMESGNIPAILELVSVGYGVSFLLESHLSRRQSERPIDCFCFSGERVLCDYVAEWRRGSYLSQYARDFVEIVRRAGTHAQGAQPAPADSVPE